MSSFKCRKKDCHKSFAKASNRLRHEKKSGHFLQSKKTSIVPEFDESKGWHICITRSYYCSYGMFLH